jgi:signal transduction histidine kinase
VSGGTNGLPKTAPAEADVSVLSARIATLERELRVRDEFLSIAAHELRNPMHALLLQVAASVQAARAQGAAGAPLVRRLERVQQIVDRYVKRASLLLDVARLNNRREPTVEDVDFAEVVREVVDSYTAEAEFHRCTLHLAIPPSLWGRWDRLGIEQIVSNLVSNAIKFGAGATIMVALARVQDGAWVQFQVNDQGIGIAQQDQDRIFGRFEQLPLPGTRPDGTGLGLWLVRELVEIHQGCISVVSAPGRGATFTVKLPVATGATDERCDGG